MVEVKNLTKFYGSIKAVDDISFTVETGEVLGFLGPNGAGKSTTMNMITGYLSSTSGTVTIDGCEILDDPIHAKSKIGYLPEIPPLYIDMTVKKYLEFMFDLKKVKLPKKEHIDEVMRLTKITEQADRIIKHLSKGYRQRVGLAQALLGNPPVIILDEPTVGLDPKQIIEIRNVIKELGKEKTVILSSHILSEISAVCDRVIIINKGKFVAEDTPKNLSDKLGDNKKMLFRISGDREKAENILNSFDGISNVTCVSSENDSYDFEFDNAMAAEEKKKMFFAFAENEIPILMQKEIEPSLEDIFLKLTDNTSEKEENTNESDI